jgi:peptide/nickel transport system substrate-binding protein
MRIRKLLVAITGLIAVALVVASCGGEADPVDIPDTPTAVTIPNTPTPQTIPNTPTPQTIPNTPTPQTIPDTPTPQTIPNTPTPVTIPDTPTPITLPPTATPFQLPTAVPTPSGPEPVQGGTLRVAGSNNRGLDPHRNTLNSGIRDVSAMVFNKLLRQEGASGPIIGDLATEWTISSAGDTLTFDIRSGVNFQNEAPVNGRAMTIGDVVYSLDRIMDPNRDDPQARIRNNFPFVTGVEAIDNDTVQITMSSSDAEILRNIAHEQTVILAPEAAIDGSYGDASSIIGTGPFLARVLQTTGGELRFERNPGYWIEGRPYVDAVTYLQNDNSEIRNSLLRTGQLDWAALQNPNHVTFYLARDNVNTSSTEGHNWGTAGLWMNITQPPFDDIRLRQAINLAINRGAITDAVYNSAAAPLGPLGNAGGLTWGLDKIWTLPGNAIDKRGEIAQAKALMAEAGHPDGFSFTIHTDPRYYDPPLAVIEAQLEADLGVEIDIVRDSSYNYRFASYVRDNAADAVFMQSGSNTPDAALYRHYRSDAPRNQSLLNDPELDAMIDRQRTLLDENERRALLDQIQQRIIDIMPVAMTVSYTWFYVAFDYVMDWHAPPEAFNFRATQFQDVWLNQ